MKEQTQPTVIIGGGIGGLTLACALEKLREPVMLFEQASDYAPLGSGLSIMGNAILALKELHLDHLVTSKGAKLSRFEVVDTLGKTIFQSPLADVAEKLGTASICISRSELQNSLVSAVSPNIIHLGKRCTNIKKTDQGMVAQFSDGTAQLGRLIVGADGFNSVTRKFVLGETPERTTRFEAYLGLAKYSDSYIGTGGVVHFWGAGQRFGLIDIGAGQTYWWATSNQKLALPNQSTIDNKIILKHFGSWHPSISGAIQNSINSQAIVVQTRDRPPSKTWYKEGVVLLGDAAHPMLTSLGQGAGIAMEDAVTLAQSISSTGDTNKALQNYGAKRIKRANDFVRLARSVAWYEQWQSNISCGLRNFIFRHLPASFFYEQAKSLLQFPRSS